MTDTNPPADRTAEIRARLDNAAIRDVPDEATDFELSRRKTAVLVLGMHAPADLAHLLGRVEELERQLGTAEAELEEQRWHGEQLQTSIESCSGNHLEIEEYPGVGSEEPTAPDSVMDPFEAADNINRRCGS